MLDQFTITTTGGHVLWHRDFTSGYGGNGGGGGGGGGGSADLSAVNDLIANCIVPGLAPADGYTSGTQCVKYQYDAAAHLVVAAAYQRVLRLGYVDALVRRVHAHVVKRLGKGAAGAAAQEEVELRVPAFDGEEFAAVFAKMLRAEEDKEDGGSKKTVAAAVGESALKPSSSWVTEDGDEEDAGVDEEMRQRMLGGRGRGKGASGKPRKTTSTTAAKSDNGSSKKKPGKLARKWDDTLLTGDEAASLNYSTSDVSDAVNGEGLMHMIDKQSMGAKTRDGLYDAQELDEPLESDSDDGSSEESGKPASRLSTLFKQLSGQRVLTKEELVPVMAKTREHLINKNVAADIADGLTKSISDALVGQRLGGWKTVHQTVRGQMETTLRQILTPKTSTDLLRDILATRGQRPYTIAFCGVNGVGKSTNLSKVCFWLLQNNLSVLIAACDTFRSGAVEQLRTHVRNLRALVQEIKRRNGDSDDAVTVELFEKGYGKDAAGIAKEAIQYGGNKGFNVVLIDTAGRMQDNEPLMRSLAKLITTNRPDKIIFVGEALVGNDAVDQVVKFNGAIRDFGGQAQGQARQIDGMILTKFDTIADKVGAAVSMCYATGQPIYFVGTGQTYTDMKKMNVKSIVGALLDR
ncbi:hypothetical protein RI367_001987 [Sorochytrium milnesiophthora]